MKDGGPAFPISKALASRDGEVRKMEVNEGMSLRDWFAGIAISGAIQDEGTNTGIAKWAYELADAMIFQREKTNDL